jgi:hypothetical protein
VLNDPLTLAFIAASFFLAGAVKGAVGMGLPTMSLGLMTLMLEPRMAITLVLIPMMTTNAWQVFRAREIPRALRHYAPFALSMMICVGLSVWLTYGAPERLLMGIMGVAILVFVGVNASKWAPHIPDHRDRGAQIIAGAFAGIMGGITSVWAPSMAIYLAARGTKKDEFVRATGLLILLGSLPLAVGYIRQGYLTPQLALIGTALLIPAMLGFTLGEHARKRLSEQAFRRALLVAFAVMGLNLLRRAVF